jgi:hypothetical protein
MQDDCDHRGNQRDTGIAKDCFQINPGFRLAASGRERTFRSVNALVKLHNALVTVCSFLIQVLFAEPCAHARRTVICPHALGRVLDDSEQKTPC